MKAALCLGLTLGVWACGSSAVPAAPTTPDPPRSRAKASAEAVAAPKVPKRTRLERAEVLQAVDAGLGRFLQHVEVEAALSDGRFDGFRIVALRPAEFWQGIDLRPGDVVVRVNGSSIERDSEAYAVFTSLRTAPALEVDYVRAGQPRRLVLPIEGQAPATEKTSSVPPAR